MRDAAHRRQHCRANINDPACSGFNLHLAAVGMMAVRAVVYCCAVLCCAVLCCALLCCAVLLLPFVLLVYARGHQKRCFITRKCSRILRTNNKRCTWSKKVPTCLFWETIYITLVVRSKRKPYRVYIKNSMGDFFVSDQEILTYLQF